MQVSPTILSKQLWCVGVLLLFVMTTTAFADQQDTDAEIAAAETFIRTVLKNDAEAIIEQLENGADVNQVTGTGQSILCAASMLGKQRAVEVLLDYGAELTDACVITAVANGRAAITELFLECGKSPDLLTAENGDHLLHMAVRAAYVDVVVVLLEQGADPSLKNSNGLTPHDLIRQRGEVIQLIENLLDNAAQQGKAETP